MEPVVGEVVGEEQQHPDPPVVRVEPERRQLVQRGVDRDHDELPDDVDRHVAEPHRDARARVAQLVADEVVLVVVAEGDRLDHEQQDEERDRVVQDLDHQALERSSSSRAERVRLVGVSVGDRARRARGSRRGRAARRRRAPRRREHLLAGDAACSARAGRRGCPRRRRSGPRTPRRACCARRGRPPRRACSARASQLGALHGVRARAARRAASAPTLARISMHRPLDAPASAGRRRRRAPAAAPARRGAASPGPASRRPG